MRENWDLETKWIHSKQPTDEKTGATVCPIYQTASYEHADPQELSDIFNQRKYGYSYTRISNPTVVYLENHLNDIERGRGAVATASGMAALNMIIESLTQAGDHIVSSNSIFGGTYYLLQEFQQNQQVAVTFVEGTDIQAYEAAITEKTKGIFCEIIGNPKLDVPNIKALSKVAKKAKIPLVADCTATTPVLYDAKAQGVDIVWYSATKWLSGNGTTVGGVIIDCGYDWSQTKSQPLAPYIISFGQLGFLARCKKLRSNKGAILSPFSAFLLQIGIETVSLRVKRQCANALTLARYFQSHSVVKEVNYPGLPSCRGYEQASQQFKKGFGGLLTIRLGSKERCFEVIRGLKLVKNLANLGDAKTLVIHPASTIYRDLTEEERERAGAYNDLIRISVGIENDKDICADFEQALRRIK